MTGRRTWTIGQVNALIRDAEMNGPTIYELAERHGRTKNSIEAKLYGIGRADLIRYPNGRAVKGLPPRAQLFEDETPADHAGHLERLVAAGGFRPVHAPPTGRLPRIANPGGGFMPLRVFG